jgi:hypothetical protein
MRWLRRKTQKVAQDFVESATTELKVQVKTNTYDYLSLILSVLPIAMGIAEIAISADVVSAPVVSSETPSIVNYGTIYILGGLKNGK